MRGLKSLLYLILFAGAIYLLASAFGLIPEKYQVETVFADQIKDTKNWIAQDANSDSMTSGLSKKLNDYLNDKPAAANTEPNSDTSYNPIDKAKKATQEYENQLNQQKKQLDDL